MQPHLDRPRRASATLSATLPATTITHLDPTLRPCSATEIDVSFEPIVEEVAMADYWLGFVTTIASARWEMAAWQSLSTPSWTRIQRLAAQDGLVGFSLDAVRK